MPSMTRIAPASIPIGVIVDNIKVLSTMTPIGMLAGAILVMDGINGLSKEIIPGIYGKESKTEGFVADGAMNVAHFMG